MQVATETVHVARQPILDQRQKVFGYELLHRASASATTCEGDAPAGFASARVIGDALLAVGLETLTDGHWAFLNLDADSLLSDAATVLAPDQVVLELLEHVPVTPEVVDAVISLSERGYAIALDDFVPGSPAEVLLPFARFVKLDVLALDPVAIRDTAQRALTQGVTVIAEKVETHEAFEMARAAGCSLFQGYYFSRPATFSARALPSSHVTQMQLLAALNQPAVSLTEIESLLKRDPSLTYRVLRTVNSAGFGLRRQIQSIREALLLLGLDQVRGWTSVWALAGLNTGPSELVTMAVIRARCCETIGQDLDGSARGDSLFLLGLCSLLEALLGHPMAQILDDLPLDAEVKAALLGAENQPRRVLDAVVHYERGEWAEAEALADGLGLSVRHLARAYDDALGWARTLARTAGAASP